MKKTDTLVKKLRGILLGLLFIAACGATGFLLAMYADSVATTDAQAFGLIFGAMLLFVLAALLQIILHEGGHMLFGLATGYEFVSFNVFGFIFHKGLDGKVKLSRMQIAGAGGQCLMAPPAYDDGNFPYTLYNLGGVAMNLLVAAVCLLLAYPVRGIPLLFLFLMAMGVVGVLFALTNGLPIPVAAIQNDGTNQRCISRDKHARRAFWVQMTIAAEVARGKRMREMPDEWFAPAPEEAMDNPIVSSVAVFAANRCMDALDLAGAEKACRALLARKNGVVELHRMSLYCDGATCEMIAGRPADLTQGLDSKTNRQLMTAMKTNPAILRTRYALALLRDRDAQQAEKVLKEFEAAAPAHPFPQEIVGERELIAVIRAAAPGEEKDA